MRFGPFKAQTEIREHQRTQDNQGSVWVTVGNLIADIYLEIDIDAIARELGKKAISNKRKRSHIMGGYIVAEAVNITKQLAHGKESKA